jgi:CHAT domain-containing protein/tetratricopeptide (TPR) repeat protein
MRFLPAAILLLCGCGPRPAERLDVLFGAASDDLHAGEPAKAQLAAEHGIEMAASRGDRVYQWKFRLLRCEILLYSGRAEEVLNQLHDAVPPTAEFAALAARKTMTEAWAILSLGRVDEGEALLAAAHQAAEAAKAGDVLVDIETIQGNRLQSHQRYDEAEATQRTALGRARALHSAYSEAVVLVNLGMIRLKRLRYDEAIPYFEKAAALAGPNSRTLYSLARSNLAICYSQLGEHGRALQIHLESVAQNERSGAKYYLRMSLGQTGTTYIAMGDLKAAIPYLERALSLASEANNSRDAAIWAGNLSHCYSELHDWQNATSFNQEAIRLKTAANVHTLFYNVLNAARIARGRGDSAEAALLYQQAIEEGARDPEVVWEAQAGLGAVALQQHRPAAAVQHFEAAVDLLEKTRFDVVSTELKLPFLTRRISLYQEYVETLIDQGESDRALAVADSSRAQVLAGHQGSVTAGRLPAEAFRGIARQNGSVLLSYWLGSARSHAWVVNAREIHHVELPPAAGIEPLVRDYQDAIERRLADPLRTRIPAGERLYQILIAPVRQWIPAGSHVILAADGVLHGLNLEALPQPPLEPGGAPRYWIEDVTMEIAPSLGLLAERPPRAPTKSGARRLLLLGDPVASDPAFPALSHAAGEIASVRRSFATSNQVILVRQAATPEAYRAARPGGFSAIHFTAHAVANRESPLDSAVLLSGGKLYAREVMDVPLTADLVTVSACRGVGLRTYSGEGLVGFAWAFLRAGAGHVIAGLWDVNDQSTAALMDVLYRELAAGKAPAAALRTAKLSLIASPGNLRKPYYWAPFQIYTVEP